MPFTADTAVADENAYQSPGDHHTNDIHRALDDNTDADKALAGEKDVQRALDDINEATPVVPY